jgi:pimeloyl-ACP methyl ester carboxylesterase
MAPPLVFVHGAGGSRLHWPPGLRRLAGVLALAVDLPGHGDSPSSGEADIEAYARRLSEWRTAVALDRPVLVGHSMGSAIALASALAEPDSLAGLVLVGSGARLRVNPTLLESVGRPEAFTAAVDKIIHWSFSREAEVRLTELARTRMFEAGPAVLSADLHACDAFDVTARLGDIRLPTLIIVGRDDRMTPPALAQELRDRIAGASLEIVEAAGHMVILEQPMAVAGHLQAFLRERSRFDLSTAPAKGDAP